MRFSLPLKNKQAGFTLVEVLIIAPIVIIAISGFIALIITMVGDVLATRDRNAMTYETRDALDRIEQDTRLSTQFLTTANNLQAPQGSDDATAPFSNTNSLILGALTTDKNPIDSTRQLVFYAKQPNDCGALQSYNRPFIGKIIYFLKSGSLWRRTYLLPYNITAPPNDETLCTTPWQQNSCTPGYLPSTRCQTNDIELMRNVTAFNTKYYATPQSTTDIGAANALSANSIEVTLTGGKSIAGRSVAYSSSIRVAKLNSIDADLPIPSAPNVTGQTGANSISFSWDAVPAATSYLIRYNIDGGGWTTATLSGTTTNYTIPNVLYRNQTVTIEVQAKNSSGTSAATTTAATVQAWIACDLGTWQNYPGYANAGFTKTNNEIVYLKGLIRFGTPTVGSVLCTLPEGYRPSANLIFLTSTAGGTAGTSTRVDVRTNGEVVIEGAAANTNWLSLESIRFVSSGAPYTRNSLALSGGWAYLGLPYSTMQSIVDSTGRVHLQGLLRNGSSTDWTVAATLPSSSQRPSHITVWPTTSNTIFNQFSVTNSGNGAVVARGINGSGYWSIQGMHYPHTFNGWTSFTPGGGWIAYDASIFAPPSYTKAADGIVSLRGVLKNGSVSSGTILTQLPVGFRPKDRLLFTTASAGAWSRVEITADGYVTIILAASSSLSLDSINFIAEQ